MTDTDHELMQRCRGGDDAAFTQLVRRWEGRVAVTLTRLASNGVVPTPSDVDDLSQEVFLKVLQAADRYRSEYAFSTWLYRIVLNVARDAGRRQRTRNTNFNRSRAQALSTEVSTPADNVERRETEEQLSAAVSSLPADVREPLILKHYGELTFAEVADVLGLPVSTVKSRVHSGLLQLRSELRRRGIDEGEPGS